MIFIDKLKEFENRLRPEFEKLFELVTKNQSHPSDLLLVYINGAFDPRTEKLNESLTSKLNPHLIGPGDEGHSEQTHYSFIDKYRTTHISKLTLSDYLKLHEYSPERSDEIDRLVDDESTTIQLEMLIYLKFWEADLIIKKLYQLVRLLNSEPYDWYFKVQESSRDIDATASRQDLIRLKIRDRIKDILPSLYDAIKNTYKTQLRNSIAHSNYSFMARNIHLNNYIEKDPASQIKVLSFDEWINIFHCTLILHNEYIRFNSKINEFYREAALKNGNSTKIRVTEKDGKQYELPVIYRQEWDDWRYGQSS